MPTDAAINNNLTNAITSYYRCHRNAKLCVICLFDFEMEAATELLSSKYRFSCAADLAVFLGLFEIFLRFKVFLHF